MVAKINLNGLFLSGAIDTDTFNLVNHMFSVDVIGEELYEKINSLNTVKQWTVIISKVEAIHQKELDSDLADYVKGQIKSEKM